MVIPACLINYFLAKQTQGIFYHLSQLIQEDSLTSKLMIIYATLLLHFKNIITDMNSSIIITEFNIQQHKTTPDTHHTPSSPHNLPRKCQHCQEYISKITQLRNQQIRLELQIHEIETKVENLSKQNQELINKNTLTYREYQKRLQEQSSWFWDKKDLQSQLFELKTIVQLLLISKGVPSHPQIKPIQIQSLKQKYSNLLIQHLRMQQQIILKDRIIDQKVFHPIYHYDERILTLRKSVAFWFKKAEEECARMKIKCKDMKQLITKETQNMYELMNSDFQKNRQNLLKVISEQKRIKGQKKQVKRKTNKMTSSLKSEIHKMR